jgi:molecular chaperone GrpE
MNNPKNSRSETVEARVDSRERLRQIWKRARLADERLESLKRLQADFDNYRKRIIKEKNELFQYATEDLIYELLPIVDNFERAIYGAGKGASKENLLQGVEMIYKELCSALKKKGLEKINVIGKAFDPTQHEAIDHVETTEHPENTVIEEMIVGYKIKDKIIRPAKVKVSKRKG